MIILQVDGDFLDEVEKTISSGEDYALELRRILIEQYGANPDMIDMEGLREQGVGQIVAATTKGCEPTPPADLLADRLPRYSKVGLKKHGLSEDVRL
jgi:hypothetical protein